MLRGGLGNESRSSSCACVRYYCLRVISPTAVCLFSSFSSYFLCLMLNIDETNLDLKGDPMVGELHMVCLKNTEEG